jgi:hypothetical protein
MGADGMVRRGRLVWMIEEDDLSQGGGPSVAAEGAVAACGAAGDSRAARGAVGVGVATRGAAGDAWAT